MKPFWPRTLQLFPAHLQARDAHIEGLLALRARLAVPDACGVLQVAFDEAQLARGQIVLTDAEAIFPSGIAAEVHGDAALRRSDPPMDAAFRVYLGVPLATNRGGEVVTRNAEDAEPATYRRSSRYELSPDAAGAQAAIRARPEILFEGEPQDRYEVLSLGVLRRAGGALRLDEQAFPTLLRVSASPVLGQRLRALVATIQRRLDELSRHRRDHLLNLKSVIAGELPGIQLASILQQHLPRLTELVARRAAHPHELYTVLVRLYGALAPFRPGDAPLSYVHEDPSAAFAWLFERILRTVDEAAREETTRLPFQRVNRAMYHLSYDRTALVGKRPYLVASGVEDDRFLRERVPLLLKMASSTSIQPLLNSALRGVTVAVEFEPPAAIPRRPDVVVYRIDVRDPLWLDIEDRTEIQLVLAEAPAALEFALYGIAQTV